MRRAFPPALALICLLQVPPARSADGPPFGDAPSLYRACGLNSLAAVLHLRGLPTRLRVVEAQLRPQPNGDSSVADIERAARGFGLQPIAVRASMRQLLTTPLPAIAHLHSRSASSDAMHYVVVVGLARRGVLVLDAPRPLAYMPYDEFERVWSGVVVSFPRDLDERDRFLAEFRSEPSWVVVAPAIVSMACLAVIGISSRPRRTQKPTDAGPESASRRSAAGSIRLPMMTCFGLVILAIPGGCSRSPAPPHLALLETTIDLGVQEAGSIPFTIPVRNSGDSPLLIHQARSSCACTVAEVPRIPILAGQADAIRGRDAVTSGEGSAEVLVNTNEPGENSRRVRLTWFGKHVPTLAPGSIDLRSHRGAVEERTVELSYPGGDTDKMRVEYLGVDGLPPGATLVLLENNPTALQVNPVLSRVSVAGRATFRLRTQAPDALGAHSSLLMIYIKQHGVTYDLPLRIHFEVDEGIRAIPSTLTFSGSTSETLGAIQRQAVIKADQPLGPLDIVEKPEYLNVDIRTDRTNQASILLHCKGPVPAGINRGVVVLRDATGRQVTVSTIVHYLPEHESDDHATGSH